MRSWLVLGALATVLGGYAGLYLLAGRGLGHRRPFFTSQTA